MVVIRSRATLSGDSTQPVQPLLPGRPGCSGEGGWDAVVVFGLPGSLACVSAAATADRRTRLETGGWTAHGTRRRAWQDALEQQAGRVAGGGGAGGGGWARSDLSGERTDPG